VSHPATSKLRGSSFNDICVVTGKKSRFVPIEDWTTMETHGDRGTDATKRMFGFCQCSGGLYYGVPNDLKIPQELKTSAANAQGNGDGSLMTLERYLTKHFQRK
jgi:hypothetical protein